MNKISDFFKIDLNVGEMIRRVKGVLFSIGCCSDYWGNKRIYSLFLFLMIRKIMFKLICIK